MFTVNNYELEKTMRTILLLILTIIIANILKAQSTNLQLIHNSADPKLANISIWVDDGFAVTNLNNDFKFREATGFSPFPAARPTTIYITPANSNIRDSIAGTTTTVNLDFTNSYIMMLVGNVDTGFKDNPNGKDTKFKLLIIEQARVFASASGKTEAIIINGSTDAPTIDMTAEGTNTKLASGIAYGEASGYTELDEEAYRFTVEDKDNNSTIGTFLAPFNNGDFQNQAPIVFSSGYVNPQENKNGAPLAWFAVVADKVTPLTNVTSTKKLLKKIDSKLYPNPTTSDISVEFSLEKNSTATIDIYSNTGKKVLSQNINANEGNNTIGIATKGLKSGIYYYTLTTKEGISTKRFVVNK